MAYAVVADIEALNAQRANYTGATKPTLTEVEDFIDQIAAQMDTVLSAAGVVAPATVPARFLVYLKQVNAWGAAALAEMAAFPEQDRLSGRSSATAFGPGSQSSRYWRLYQDALTALKDGSEIDADAPRQAASTILARSYQTDNPDGLTDAQLAPVFGIRDVY